MSLFHARMKKIQLKMKALVWSHQYLSIFKCPRAANSIICDGIWQKFKLMQACMVVLDSYKNDEYPFENEALEWSQHLSQYMSIGCFPDAQGQITLLSEV